MSKPLSRILVIEDEPLSLRDNFVHLLERARDAPPALLALREEHVLALVREHHTACELTATEIAQLRTLWQRQVDAIPLWAARFGPKVAHEHQLQAEALKTLRHHQR